MEVDVIPFLERIINSTKAQSCSWEKTGSDAYRLLLRNGSVTIKKEKEPLLPSPLEPPVIYRLRLFDQTDCFLALEISDRNTVLCKRVSELFRVIRDEENRVVNEKISSLMSDLP